MAKGINSDALIIAIYEYIERGVLAGFDIDAVTDEIRECVDTAYDDYIYDHEDN